MRPVTLLWFEPVPAGSAARTHLDGTRRRLASEGIEPSLELRAEDGGQTVLQKLRRLLSLVRAARRVRDKGVLVTRWHPFLWFVAGAWHRGGGRIVLLVQGNDETVYESYPWFRKIPFSGRLISGSLKAGDRVLVLNAGLQTWVDEVRGRTRSASVVLDTGVSDVFANARPGGVDRGPYALFFGNLARWQGIDYLLEATRAPEWPDDVSLLVVGDGEMREAVQAAPEPRVQWLGKMAPPELATLVAGAVVTLCTKGNYKSMANTTTPFKMLESAAAGVPVIATDIPAQRAMIEADGYGLLVSVDEPRELALAVARIAHDTALRDELAQKARDLAPSLVWEHGSPALAHAIESA